MTILGIPLPWVLAGLVVLEACEVRNSSSLDDVSFGNGGPVGTQASETFAGARRVLAQNCFRCHGTWSTWSEADFLRAKNVDGAPYVKPRDLAGSYFYQKLRGVGAQGNMPADGAGLGAADRQAIADWVLAINDTGVPPPPPEDPPPPVNGEVTFARVYAEIFRPLCLECHGTTVQKAGVRFDRFEDAVRSLDAALAATNAGRMPVGGPALSPALMVLLRTWKSQGAPRGAEPPPAEEPLPPLTPTFASIRARILKPKCLECHSRQPARPTRAQRLPFDEYADLVRGDDLIDFRRPERSEIFEVTSEGEMPPSPNPRLSSEELQTILTWIRHGARND